jgi:hypothetical protein
MSRGFSVIAGVLQAGSEDMAVLQQNCLNISSDVMGGLSAMAGAAGDQGLVSALKGAAGQGNRTLTGMWAAYGQSSKGLATSAQNYTKTEQGITSQINAVTRGGWRGVPQP